MNDVEICAIVQEHIKNNNGFSLDWLERHQRECALCRQLTSIVSVCVDEMMSPIIDELKDEDKEYMDE